MSTPHRQRHLHEPEEPRLDALNELLDRVERDARAIVDGGGEVALRSRLARVLGDGMPAAAQARRGRAGPGRRSP